MGRNHQRNPQAAGTATPKKRRLIGSTISRNVSAGSPQGWSWPRCGPPKSRHPSRRRSRGPERRRSSSSRTILRSVSRLPPLPGRPKKDHGADDPEEGKPSSSTAVLRGSSNIASSQIRLGFARRLTSKAVIAPSRSDRLLPHSGKRSRFGGYWSRRLADWPRAPGSPHAFRLREYRRPRGAANPLNCESRPQ